MNQFMKTKTPGTEAASITDSVTESTAQLSGRTSTAKIIAAWEFGGRNDQATASGLR